jgi:hypothetical protein
MTPTTPQNSQDDIFFTPVAYRQSSIQPDSLSDQSLSTSDTGVDGGPSNTGEQEAIQEDPNDNLSWTSSPPTRDLQVLLYYSLVARKSRITYNHSPLLKDGLSKRQRRGKTRMANTIFNTSVVLREVRNVTPRSRHHSGYVLKVARDGVTVPGELSVIEQTKGGYYE